MNSKDKQLLRALIAQLVTLAMMGNAKADRYLVAADACDQAAERLRERAEEAALAEAKNVPAARRAVARKK